METKCKKCPICGSEEIHSISISEDENGNIIHKYKCDSCDSYFSSNNSNHKENKANAINSLNFNINKEAFINKTISPKDIFEQDIKYTVELYCKYENECVSTGTGIIITNQYIITNAHVVMYNHEYFKKCSGITNKKEILDLELVAIDEDQDIAFLKTNVLFKDCIPYRTNKVNTGEVCYTIGNSNGQGLSFLNGIISDSNRIIDNKEYILFSAPVTSGNSGGPLIDENGAMIGMVTLKTKDEIGMNYAIPNSVISKYLSNLKNTQD